MTEVAVDIVKLVNGGQALGFHRGKPVFAWNALPGETVVVEATKVKKDYLEGTAVRIDNPSPERIDPEEDHFLSCSPWQIMTSACENHWKKEIAKETFKRISGVELPDFEIVHDEKQFGYRNKIEYAFCPDGNGDALGLALHKRGTHQTLAIGECLLAAESINRAAAHLLDRLNEARVGVKDVQSLVLRMGGNGRVVASLIAANEDIRFPRGPVCDDLLAGFHVYFAHPGGVTSSPLTILSSEGEDSIQEHLAGKAFRCGSLSFFQVNLGIFEKAVSRVSDFVGAEDEIVDFYSGVGAIGIALADKVKSCLLIESDEEASTLAGKNSALNGSSNCATRRGRAETMLGEIKQEKTVIFDPPRAGLHPKVVERVLEAAPRKIIYLSCDVATLARDLKMLSQKYKVSFCELYNFFPRTPHIESLLVLETR